VAVENAINSILADMYPWGTNNVISYYIPPLVLSTYVSDRQPVTNQTPPTASFSIR
jgi:hypothetical protein